MSLAHYPSITRGGLLIHLDAANIKSYPGSGLTWYDMSGFGRNGTLRAVHSFSSSPQSIVFNGSDSYLALPSSINVLPLIDMTIEVVFKTPGMGSGKTQAGLFSLNYGMVTSLLSNGTPYFVVWDGTPSATALSMNPVGTSYLDNKWHHAVFILQAAYGYIYIDGTLIATTSAAITARTGTNQYADMAMRIGDNPNDQYYDINGNISIVRLYNRGLSPAEVQQNFSAIRGRYGI